MNDHRKENVVVVTNTSSAASASRQSPGIVPTTPTAATATPTSNTKRNSGLFSFLKWFRSSSRESVDDCDFTNSSIDGTASVGGSNESLNSTGTAASFSFVPPAAYAPQNGVDKCINPGPETDTYRARLKQRDRIREKDKNITLRKKYNLFFNRDKDKDTSGKKNKDKETPKSASSSSSREDNCKSLPLMTKRMEHHTEDGGDKGHRRTNSDSSKNRKAGAYLHVKGKRKAPAPPPKVVGKEQAHEGSLSLRRKKRLAPQPPPHGGCTTDKIITVLNSSEDIEYADVDGPAILQNDSLRLDHGVLRQAKPVSSSPQARIKGLSMLGATKTDIPVSPKPWYKRATSSKRDSKYEPVSPVDNNNDKRKSNMMFLTNISELDREASEIVKKNRPAEEMPEFMKPKLTSEGCELAAQPSKRKSAKDLIAKFNAITNVTKVTVNSAFFGGVSPSAAKEKRDYFGRDKKDLKDNMMNNNRENAAKLNGFATPLMKCETSACIIKTSTPTTPKLDKMDRKNWACPKCNMDNDYWRIICHVCSTIKPYFDDLGSLDTPLTTAVKCEKKEIAETSGQHPKKAQVPEFPLLARSKTQIHFSHQNHQRTPPLAQQSDETKREEKEKLKKMLIEMKNSLPKRRSHLQMQNRKSTIDEGPENPNLDSPKDDKLQEIAQKIVQKEEEVKSTQAKPSKVSSSVQTSAVVVNVKKSPPKESNYQLLRPKDFEEIYTEKVGTARGGGTHVYANLGEATDLFFNVPKKLNDLKQNLNSSATDTLEINKLLRRLETAIAKGDLTDAAGYARDLAQLKVNCSVIRQRSEFGNEPGTALETSKINGGFMVEMYVEDRLSHRGPFPIEVLQTQTVLQLKQQVQKEFDIPKEVQRWILGKELATDDKATLKNYNVTSNGCPIFLYLVAPVTNSTEVKELNTDQKSAVQGATKDASALPRSSNSAFAVVTPAASTSAKTASPEKEKKILNTSGPGSASPKIVGEQLKVHVMIKPSDTNVIKIDPLPNSTKHELVTAIKTSVVVQQGPPLAKTPPKAVQEDFTEYDKTLRPKKEVATNWVCHMCTLVNIPTTNVCSVCATVRQKEESTHGATNQLHYFELMNLDNADLVSNAETFECLVCLTEVKPTQGVTLRECLHQFCKACLSHTIEYSEEAEVKCPYRDAVYSCDIALQDREIKALVTKHQYDQFLAKSVAQAENKMDKSFHCKTPDCTGWCVYEDNVNDFRCPICKRTNCLTCQAIHLGLNCRQYQERMNAQSETDDDAKQTREMLNEMVEKGEALTCPACHVILMKKWGCDWVRCSMCKTEICWVTRGLRWGPGGKNDTTGGCKCGVNGVKCHPKCNYCH